MTNPKIKKVKADIAKTKAAISTQQAKLRELEAKKTQLENEEIVAMFRREKLDENEFAALLHSQRIAAEEGARSAEEHYIRREGDE